MDRIKVNLRMGSNDEDLILLTRYYKLKQALIFAVRKHLNQSSETLPLPPPTDVPANTWNQATVYKQAAPDVYQFLKGIPEQKRSIVIKRLLRHATVECDLRALLKSMPQARTKSALQSTPDEATERLQRPAKDTVGSQHGKPVSAPQKTRGAPKGAVPKVYVNLDAPQKDTPDRFQRTPPHNEYRGKARDGLSTKKPSDGAVPPQKTQLKDSSHEQQRPCEQPAQPIQSQRANPSGDDIWSQL